jgi:hypothetical protein
MNKTKLFFAVLSAAALSLTVSATPIPLSAIGINKLVNVTGHPYNVSGGGGFSAIVDGHVTTVWCVDDQNNINPGSSSAIYRANVILIHAWPGGLNALVRKGTVTFPNWGDGDNLTPLQRYQAAAWLVSQYSGFPNGPSNSGAGNTALQNAAWRMTHTGAGAPAANANYTAAVNFIDNPMNAGYGFGKWAVISGVVNSAGVLSTSDTRQTFLVQVATPEPGTYMMLGAGLIVVALAGRKRLA